MTEGKLGVSLLAIYFLILYTSFSGGESLMSEIYDDNKYKNLGQLNTFTLYIVFSLANPLGERLLSL